MKKIIVTLTLISLSMIGLPTYGGETKTTATFEAKTGDAALDTTLGNLNIQTHGSSISDFISNLSVSYDVPIPKIEYLIFEIKMTPADAYMTVGISNILNKPLDDVVKKYKANRGKGWGVIAKQMGIKPGSKEFHALKNGGSVELEKVKGKGKAKGKKKSKKSKKEKKK